MTRMRWIVAGVAVAASAALLGSVLTAPAYAETVFGDTFDDGDANGWSRSGGSWSVVTDGSPALRQSSTSANARILAGATSWTDYTLQVRVRPIAFTTLDRTIGVAARVQSSTAYYALVLTGSGAAQLQKVSGGTATVLATAAAGGTTGTWHTLALSVQGTTLRGAVDGTPLLQATDSTFGSGRIGLVAAYASASYDDVTVDTGVPTPTPSSSTPPKSTPPPAPGSCAVTGSPAGFATVNAWGQNGTTGGAGGPVVDVGTAAELLAAIARVGPLTICVTGTITLPAGMYDVTSNKSIVGVGSTAGITGGGLNIGLPVSAMTTPPDDAVRNVIIQNLTFRNASDDSINVQMFSHHVWIDHNDLAQGYDGLIDIKRGSSYVTVSWNHTHHHTKNMLLGHDDANGAQDTGRLKVTYHHNWFDATPQRNPRVRFGEPVHVYNNYYFYNTDTGVACQNTAGCLVEGNYFSDVEEPVTNTYAGPAGRCVARNNVFTGESGTPVCSGTVQEPSTYYSYTLDDPATVKATVTAGAGVGRP
ncbi:pectate lyase family protein [Actinoplanes awajinensis]|uniref:Pectate lyase n=1 Tax=Actinoplanes awajinensis subsp. mycoplanecinus TaxID=135947 RepID=A0A101JRE2_9ACTN|nr:family 16 glycoside hydrolase [Actinoplanes awajinensis]KUL31700.1 pectate lyase [Actinoplanes awajinensis subsp. mycoplanecinus]